MARILFVLLLLLAPAFGGAQAAGEMSPRERYELGLKFLRRGSYTRALQELNRVRNFHRDDPASVLAELAIADLHFKKGDFEQARLAYDDFARLHPRHPQMDYVIYRTGLAIYKRAPKFAGRDQTGTTQAVNTWTGFDARFPESDYIPDVEPLLRKGRERLAAKEMFIAHFYARRDAWRSVRMRTATLLKRYPDSNHAPRAMALEGEALHRWGFTKDAQALRDELAAEFPHSAALGRLEHVLKQPAGFPPEEQIFVRPYRVSSGIAANPGTGM